MPSLKKRSHKGYERVATDDLDEIAESYGPEDVPVPKVLHDFDPNVRPALSPSPPPPPPALRPCSAAHALRTGGYRAWSSRCCAPDGQAVATPGFGEEGASRTLGCQRPSPRASPVCCVQVRSKCEATLWVGGCIWLLKYLDFIYVVLESNKVDRCA